MTRKDGLRALAVCLVLSLGTMALYSPVFGFNFVNYGDEVFIAGNPHVSKGLAGAFGWAFGAGYGNVWQPLAWLSHALDCQIYGLKPGGHHATSLILHALNAVLVFLVLRQLTGAFWRSAVVAAFFAWHPLHIEAFAWVAGRNGLLGAFFCLLALWCYACYAEKAKALLPGAKFYYIGTVILFAFAVMSNLATVTLPVILLLLDWWPLRRFGTSGQRPAAKEILFILAEKIPLLILAVAAGVVTLRATASLHVNEPMADLPYRIRVATAGMSCFRYLAESFWPADLASTYPFVLHYPKWELIGAAVALVGVSVVAVVTRKTRPYWLAGWLWFLITLTPVLNLLQAGAQPMADRYMYIPSIGLWMLICWEAYDLAAARPSGRKVLMGLCAVLLLACCVLSSIQLRCWASEGTLLARISGSDSNGAGHAEYANYLFHHNQLPQAETEAQKAVAIAPSAPALALLLGEILLSESKFDKSIENLQSALRLDHTMEAARMDLGQAYFEKGQLPAAGAEFNLVVQHAPTNFIAHYWLARTFVAQSNTPAAAAEYAASLHFNVDQPLALNDLAWLLATDPHPEMRNGAKAVQLADRACTLTKFQAPALLGTLAAAYAEAGDFDKAVRAGQMAHDAALAQGSKALAETNLQLVALYRDHKPFHTK
jgi:protein O-mannosyl-transferase